ncbi:hypothetical protein IPA_08530 [Ignicoccus pacificus DSM 13166]|uniref:Uncharacterized protein n=1 Tax=Ignicoccus pacificus DSM 13166 TaxID=940294 RepID=A0A977KC07_9CREN|nr:hypothetical protein IPA_08530 [Ignicoccus pacificus DSM 13166]
MGTWTVKEWITLILLLVALPASAELYAVQAQTTVAYKNFNFIYPVSYLKTNVLTIVGSLTYTGELYLCTVTLSPSGCVALIEGTAISLPPYTGRGIYYFSIPTGATYAACSGIMTSVVTVLGSGFSGNLTFNQGITTYTEIYNATENLYYVYTVTVTWTQVLKDQVIVNALWNCTSPVYNTVSFNIPKVTIRASTYNGTNSTLITVAPFCPGSLPLVTATAYVATVLPLTPQVSVSTLLTEVNTSQTTTPIPLPLLLVPLAHLIRRAFQKH